MINFLYALILFNQCEKPIEVKIWRDDILIHENTIQPEESLNLSLPSGWNWMEVSIDGEKQEYRLNKVDPTFQTSPEGISFLMNKNRTFLVNCKPRT